MGSRQRQATMKRVVATFGMIVATMQGSVPDNDGRGSVTHAQVRTDAVNCESQLEQTELQISRSLSQVQQHREFFWRWLATETERLERFFAPYRDLPILYERLSDTGRAPWLDVGRVERPEACPLQLRHARDSLLNLGVVMEQYRERLYSAKQQVGWSAIFVDATQTQSWHIFTGRNEVATTFWESCSTPARFSPNDISEWNNTIQDLLLMHEVVSKFDRERRAANFYAAYRWSQWGTPSRFRDMSFSEWQNRVEQKRFESIADGYAKLTKLGINYLCEEIHSTQYNGSDEDARRSTLRHSMWDRWESVRRNLPPLDTGPPLPQPSIETREQLARLQLLEAEARRAEAEAALVATSDGINEQIHAIEEELGELFKVQSERIRAIEEDSDVSTAQLDAQLSDFDAQLSDLSDEVKRSRDARLYEAVETLEARVRAVERERDEAVAERDARVRAIERERDEAVAERDARVRAIERERDEAVAEREAQLEELNALKNPLSEAQAREINARAREAEARARLAEERAAREACGPDKEPHRGRCWPKPARWRRLTPQEWGELTSPRRRRSPD